MPYLQSSPDTAAVGSATPRGGAVHAAIARASAATGVNFDYLLAQAKLESGLDPNARAGTSSAAGLYQFVSGTWLETMDRHGAQHGLGWAEDAISRSGGRAVVANPQMRAEVMALRFDPDAASLMAAELARDNAADLRGFLGREPDHTELYLAHFLGSGGARDFLGAMQRNPQQSAAALFPKAGAANRAVFYDGGRARSLGEVMDFFRGKMARAMEDGGLGTGFTSAYRSYGGMGADGLGSWDSGGLIPRLGAPVYSPASSTSGPQGSGAGTAPATRPSMAETLKSTFGSAADTGGSLARDSSRQIDAAYSKFRSFGL